MNSTHPGGSIKLATYKQAAEMLQISRTTLNKLIDRGELNIVRVMADAPRIKVSDLERFVAARYTGVP